MKKLLFIILIVFLSSCSLQNSNLISYNSEYLGEDEKYYDQVSEKINPKYDNGKIYISEIIAVNACGDYEGDIEIVKDSIYLIQDNSSFTLCSSQQFVKVEYIINNPRGKKYKFDFKFE